MLIDDTTISATLQAVVTRAIAALPGATRGCLLLANGTSLEVAALVGYGSVDLAEIPVGPTATLSDEPAYQAAALWHATFLPDLAATPALAERLMLSAPVQQRSGSVGLLAIDFPLDTASTARACALTALFADQVALLLERRQRYLAETRTAQYVHLLDEVVASVADSNDLPALIDTVAAAIKSVLPHQQHAAVRLTLRDPESDQLHVYSFSGRPIGAYWRNVYEGARAAGRDLGTHIAIVSGATSTAQEAAIDGALSLGAQGIALAPLDPVALEPAIRRARAAGIPLVTTDTPPIPASESLIYIGTDNHAAGKLAGQVLLRLLPQGGAVGIGVEALQAGNVIERMAGLREAVEGTPITLLPPLDDQHDPEYAAQLALELLHARPDLAGALGVCAGNGPGWGVAAQAAGKAGKLPILSFDLTAETIELLKAGVVQAAIAQREYMMGYGCVSVLARMAAFGIAPTMERLPATRIIDTGVDVVTLAPTSWSDGLADYLLRPPSSLFRDVETRQQLAQRGLAEPIVIIGMAAQAGEGHQAQSVPNAQSSLAAQVLRDAQPLIIDTHTHPYAAMPDVAAARERGARRIVVVPLMAGGGIIGVLSIESALASGLGTSELALLEQTARTVAVAINNLRLVSQLRARTSDLERAYQHQSLLAATINDLSSPVVPIARDILVVPLVGAINSQRAERIIETVLRAIGERQARVLLIDISGVPLVDTQVASALLGVTQAARLLGAEVVLVGITPPVAQTIVHLGVDLSTITTHADLARGFAYALSRVGGKIVFS